MSKRKTAGKAAAETTVAKTAQPAERPSRAEADKNWRAFLNDEEWKKVVAETEKDGPLATKVDRVFMDATAFSKLK